MFNYLNKKKTDVKYLKNKTDVKLEKTDVGLNPDLTSVFQKTDVDLSGFSLC